MSSRPWTPAEEHAIWERMDGRTGSVSSKDRVTLSHLLHRSLAAINSRINVVRVIHAVRNNLSPKEAGRILQMRSYTKSTKGEDMPLVVRYRRIDKNGDHLHTTPPSKVRAYQHHLDELAARVGATMENPAVFDYIRTGNKEALALAGQDQQTQKVVLNSHWKVYTASHATQSAIADEAEVIILAFDGRFRFRHGPKNLPVYLRAEGFKVAGATLTSGPETEPPWVRQPAPAAPTPLYDSNVAELVAQVRTLSQAVTEVRSTLAVMQTTVNSIGSDLGAAHSSIDRLRSSVDGMSERLNAIIDGRVVASGRPIGLGQG